VVEWIQVLLLGVIEGVTEFLPVSSTGHLLIAQKWLGRRSDLFNTVIQTGAVLAVVLIFTARIRQLVFQWREPAAREYILKLTVAFAITCVGGLLLKSGGFQLPDTARPVALATLIGGMLFLAVERWLRGRVTHDQVTWRAAIAVAFGQLLAAVFPGASRSGSTILMALCLGVNRPAATEFSFLLGIPTLLAAGVLQIYAGLKDPAAAPEDWGLMALAWVAAAVTAFVTVKWLLRFVQTHTFEGFGWYRIALGAALLLLAV
jgi:undecaprenyl-diphosphatase